MADLTVKNLSFSAEEIDVLLNKINNLDLSNVEGVAPTLKMGTVTTLKAGEPATASFTQVGDNGYVLNLGIPKGSDGVQGKDGDTPMFGIGTVTSGDSVSVTLTGEPPNYILNFTFPSENVGGMTEEQSQQLATNTSDITTLKNTKVDGVSYNGNSGKLSFLGNGNIVTSATLPLPDMETRITTLENGVPKVYTHETTTDDYILNSRVIEFQNTDTGFKIFSLKLYVSGNYLESTKSGNYSVIPLSYYYAVGTHCSVNISLSANQYAISSGKFEGSVFFRSPSSTGMTLYIPNKNTESHDLSVYITICGTN